VLFCQAAPGATEGLRPGEPAPAFVAKAHDDAEFYLRDYCGEPRGKRHRQERNILVLSFFASWCKPCKAEMPMLQELASRYRGDGVLFYLVNKGQPRDTVSNFLFDQVVSLPVLMDQYEVLAKKYHVRELPTLVIIGKDGRLAEYHTGYNEGYQGALAFKLDSLLGKPLPRPQTAAADSAAKPKPKTKGRTSKKKSN
jgi:thiol-disulfide isomerase/thioredoxin